MKSVMKQSGARFRLFHHRTLLTGLLLLTLPGFFPVAADSLFFTVTATVVEPTCTVPSALRIVMNNIDGAELEKNTMTEPTWFDIKLEKCNSELAEFRFNSATPDQLGNFFYPSDGDARGFLLAFTDEQSKHIKLGDKINRTLEPADNTLRFGVQAIRDTGNELVPGDFSAVATVTIVYR